MPMPGLSTADTTYLTADKTYLNASDNALPAFNGDPTTLWLKQADGQAANGRNFNVPNQTLCSTAVY